LIPFPRVLAKRVPLRCHWDSRDGKTRAADLPALNMIFERG